MYNQLELLAFHKIAFAHTLAADNYTFHVDTQGEGLTFQWQYHKGVDKSGPEYYWITMGSTAGCKTDTTPHFAEY